MLEAASRIRAGIEFFRRAEADVLLGRLRGDPEADTFDAWTARSASIRSEELLGLLESTGSSAAFEPGEREASAAHLARAAAEAILAPGRAVVEAWPTIVVHRDGRTASLAEASARAISAESVSERRGWALEVEAALSSLADVLLALREDADEAARAVLSHAPSHPDAGLEPSASSERAERFLAETEDAAVHVLGELGLRPGAGSRVEDLAYVLTAGEVSSFFPAKDRLRRLAESLAGLGFSHDLRQRVRVEERRDGIDPRPRVVAREVPADVRIARPAVERGLISELHAAEALGRALAFSLVAPALPVALRRPVVGTVARGVGGLFVQLHAEPVYLKHRALGARSAELVARRATATLLLETRLAAAASLARRSAGTREERIDRASILVDQALGVGVPRPLAVLLALTPSGAGARFRSSHTSLGIYAALRARYDEDWFRNPRAAEPIRAAAARGGTLSIEAFGEELGVREEDAAVRVRELVAR